MPQNPNNKPTKSEEKYNQKIRKKKVIGILSC